MKARVKLAQAPDSSRVDEEFRYPDSRHETDDQQVISAQSETHASQPADREMRVAQVGRKKAFPVGTRIRLFRGTQHVGKETGLEEVKPPFAVVEVTIPPAFEEDRNENQREAQQ